MTVPAPQNRNPKRFITTRRMLLATLLLLATPILTYTVLAVRFYSGKPAITTNHAAEIEALHAHHPDEQRSWTILLEIHQRWIAMEEEILDAAAAQGHFATFPRLPELTPDHALFPFVAERIRQTPDLLDLVHEAAGKAVIGQPVTFDIPTESPDQPFPPDPDPANQPPLYFSLAPWITHARTAHSLLVIELRVAFDGSDPDRAMQTVRSLLSIADLTQDEPWLLASMVASQMTESTAVELVELIEDHPQVLNDQQLAELQGLLIAAMDQSALINFRAERALQQDVLQRIFSPGGRLTSAIMHPDFSIFLTDSNFPSPIENKGFRVLAPVLVLFVGSRSDHDTYFDESTHTAERAATNPGEHYRDLAERDRAAASLAPIARARHLFCHALEPGYSHAVEQQVNARTRLQATATRLALERYKLAQGHYPDTLNQLVPTYLPELPADPFNPGHPLNYLLRDGTPYIYSVGSNGIDNQATPAPPNTRPDSLKARFADPNGPSPDAPAADWILSPLQDRP